MIETLNLDWNLCQPGSLPEDICNESEIEVIKLNGNIKLGPFLLCNLDSNGRPSYSIGSRYKKVGANRWTWSGLHPGMWKRIPKPDADHINLVSSDENSHDYESVKVSLSKQGYSEIMNNFNEFHSDHYALFVKRIDETDMIGVNPIRVRYYMRLCFFNSQHILISYLDTEHAKKFHNNFI